MNFAIVGAGFTGSVLANELSREGHSVNIFESRAHIGGNCYTEKDDNTNIIIHKYGPHIFHTDNEKVWSYINQFANFMPFVNRVKTTTNGKVYSLPINLHTINQFFNKTLNPTEAEAFIKQISIKNIVDPISFEDQALKFVGYELYKTFFEGYTLKQWGISPKDLPASILKRLPLRFNYDDNYFNHKYQGIPQDGYTSIFENLLGAKNINLHLNTFFNENDSLDFDHVFYTGPIDSYFNYKFGRLAYRTLDFVKEYHDNDFQGCAVMNYGDQSVPYTRISEHKHFSPWYPIKQTVIFKEYSRDCDVNDIPYYPIRLVNDKSILHKYINEAKSLKNISFLGRLGTYRYIDMDVTIGEALSASEEIAVKIKNKQSIPVFFVNPI
jgi:UDP-galactopyranose mutase